MRRVLALLLLAFPALAGEPEDLVRQAQREIAAGRREEGLAALDQALAQAPGHLEALVAKGRLLDRMGRRGEADGIFAAFPERIPALAGLKTASEITALAAGCQEQALRTHDKGLLKRVMSELYTAAQRKDPRYPAARHEAGLLFAGKYQYRQAAGEFEAALKADPRDAFAWYGLALAAWGKGDFGKAQEACAKALEIDPRLEEALLLLADLAVWDEDEAEALKHVRAVLGTNAESLEAMAYEAALSLVGGDEARGRSRLARIEELCPRWPGAFRIVAGAFESRHRSKEAIAWLERGLKAVPEDPGLMTDLGHVLLHTVRQEEGRTLLEKVYALDPFSSRVSNTLNLLDEIVSWPVITTRHFRIRCHPAEAELLGGLLAEALERDYAEITALYGYEPAEQPVDVELYPDPSDFSVRTVGQPNLGALGVCFGRLVALDSPAARERMGPFHWGDVARHEFTHVVTLQLSDFRVPRWLTEGLSVYAERYDRFQDDQMMVNAMAEGRILGLADLNKAYSRPAYPGQIQLAYAQGGRIARWIAETWGMDAVKRMLRAYRQGADTPKVLKDVLGMTPAAFDRAFMADLKEEMKKVQRFPLIDDQLLKKLLDADPQDPGAQIVLARQFLARGRWGEAARWAERALRKAEGEAAGEAAALRGEALRRQGKAAEAEPLLQEAVAKRPDHCLGHLGLGQILRDRGEWDAAIAAFRQARRCYPNAVTGDDSPYLLEASCCFSAGRTDEAVAALRAFCRHNGLDVDARLSLAGALKDQGKPEEALKVLDESLMGEVFRQEVHRARAEILKALKRLPEAAAAAGLGSHAAPKEIEAALAAAEAWLEAGDPAKARAFWERAKGIAKGDARVKALGERLGGQSP